MAVGHEPSHAQKIFHSFDLLHKIVHKLHKEIQSKNGKTINYSAGYNNGLIGYFLIQTPITTQNKNSKKQIQAFKQSLLLHLTNFP